MSDNESGSSDRENNASLMRLRINQTRRRKEVSFKAGETLKEHPKRKRPKSCGKSSSNRSTNEEKEVPHRKGNQKETTLKQRNNKTRKKKHRRYSTSPSQLSSSNDDSDESKDGSNEARKTQIPD